MQASQLACTVFLNTISRNGIYYNLKVSSYKYDDGSFTFRFSSKLNLEKFKKAVVFWESDINERFRKKFGCELICKELSHFLLYEKIEKRGYYVTQTGGIEEICLDEMELNGKLEKKLNSNGH